MINEVIRARVVASGFAPEHVDAVAAQLTRVAATETERAMDRYIEAAYSAGGGGDYRFGAIFSIACGQPASGRYFESGSSTVTALSREYIVERYGSLAGLTDDPVLTGEAEPFPFRFVSEAPAILPEPMDEDDEDEDDEDEDDDSEEDRDY
jgi:hypothetical protein